MKFAFFMIAFFVFVGSLYGQNILSTLAAFSVAQNLSLLNHEFGHMNYGGHNARLELELNPLFPQGCTYINGRGMSFEQKWKFGRAGLAASTELDKSISNSLSFKPVNPRSFLSKTLAATALWSKLDITGYVLADELRLNNSETSDIQNLKRVTGKGNGYFRTIAVVNVVLNIGEIRNLWNAVTGRRPYKQRDRTFGFQSDGVESYVTYYTRF